MTEEWDVDSGVLSMSQFGSPTFRSKEGKTIWLLATEHMALKSLIGSFEMSTLPDKNNHNNQFWIGNVHLNKDNTYAYAMEGLDNLNKEQRLAQKNNFFMLHPKGTFNIQFVNGYTEKTFLEDIPNETKLCEIEFLPEDESQKQIYGIMSYERWLNFINPDSPFELTKSWN